MQKCCSCEKLHYNSYRKTNTICQDCYMSGNFIQRKEATKRKINQYDFTKYWHQSNYCFNREDVDEEDALNKTELDDVRLSERYGDWTSEKRYSLVGVLCKKEKLDFNIVAWDQKVDLFCEYGFIYERNDEEFFQQIINRHRLTDDKGVPDVI